MLMWVFKKMPVNILLRVMFFIYCRSLRKQHRIRLHINLFLSFLLKEVMDILWDMLVTYDKVTSTTVFETTLMQNGVSLGQKTPKKQK